MGYLFVRLPLPPSPPALLAALTRRTSTGNLCHLPLRHGRAVRHDQQLGGVRQPDAVGANRFGSAVHASEEVVDNVADSPVRLPFLFPFLFLAHSGIFTHFFSLAQLPRLDTLHPLRLASRPLHPQPRSAVRSWIGAETASLPQAADQVLRRWRGSDTRYVLTSPPSHASTDGATPHRPERTADPERGRPALDPLPLFFSPSLHLCSVPPLLSLPLYDCVFFSLARLSQRQPRRRSYRRVLAAGRFDFP